MLQIDGTARFISDLHLRSERPDLTERFFRFLADCAAAKIESLFILGDLFEYWIGDDNLADPFIANVVARLRELSEQGTRIFFIHGNRDFLIGTDFATACGITLLPELQKVGAGETAILLLHGDTLCTDDHSYQDFRRAVRSLEWQESFLAQSLSIRRAEVEALRRRSSEAVQTKTAEIMDANPHSVRETLVASGCQRMIHGHTHRPGRELLDAAVGSERWVLSDWDHGRGDALEVSAAGIQRLDWLH